MWDTPEELHHNVALGLFLIILQGNILGGPGNIMGVLIKPDVFISACSLQWGCVELKLDLLCSHKKSHDVQGFFFPEAVYMWECFRLLPPSGHKEFSILSRRA